MNTMADGASEHLDAQIADALFGQPGMSKMDVANRLREVRGDGAPVLADVGNRVSPSPAGQGDTPEIEQLRKLVSNLLSTVSLGYQTGPYAYAGEDFGGYLREAASNCRAIMRGLSDLAARRPVGERPMEMRICELRQVSLKPNRPYVFTVDANCANCRADAAYAMGNADTRPAQAVDLGQFRLPVEFFIAYTFPGTPSHVEGRRLLALIDSKAVGNGQ